MQNEEYNKNSPNFILAPPIGIAKSEIRDFTILDATISLTFSNPVNTLMMATSITTKFLCCCL